MAQRRGAPVAVRRAGDPPPVWLVVIDMNDDEILRAVRYKLGISEPEEINGGDLWQKFQREMPSSDLVRLAREFGGMVERVMLRMLDVRPKTAASYDEEQMVKHFFAALMKSDSRYYLLRKLKDILRKPEPWISKGTRRIIQGMHPAAKPPEPSQDGRATFPKPPKSAPTQAAVQPAAAALPLPQRVNATPSASGPPVGQAFAGTSPENQAAGLNLPAPAPQPETGLPPSSAAAEELPPGANLWKYVDVQDPTDRRTDNHCEVFEAPPGFRLMGARVRGRKHKHEGTYCDDWFEVRRSAGWEIIAVSDGAGSCSLSRVGAKLSTETTATFLERKLAGFDLDLPIESDGLLERDEQGAFRHPEVERLQGILHAAVSQAVQAVQDEANKREIDVKKLSSTLRLAIHRKLDSRHSLLMACSVGDGMTAAIETNGELHLLGQEESGGKHSGETEFLTDPRFVTPERLAATTFARVIPLRAVMVMSDGVADPYFPNGPGMVRLYADLLLNRVLDPGSDGEGGLDGEVPLLAKYSYLIQTPVGQEPTMSARIRQSDRFANELDKPVEDLIKWPPRLLVAGGVGEPMHEDAVGAAPEQRLRIWLDMFYVRGEFDDRTLVILHREAGS